MLWCFNMRPDGKLEEENCQMKWYAKASTKTDGVTNALILMQFLCQDSAETGKGCRFVSVWDATSRSDHFDGISLLQVMFLQPLKATRTSPIVANIDVMARAIMTSVVGWFEDYVRFYIGENWSKVHSSCGSLDWTIAVDRKWAQWQHFSPIKSNLKSNCIVQLCLDHPNYPVKVFQTS